MERETAAAYSHDLAGEGETDSASLDVYKRQLYCHLDEEADEVLVGCFRTNHTEDRNVFLSGFGWDDEEMCIRDRRYQQERWKTWWKRCAKRYVLGR